MKDKVKKFVDNNLDILALGLFIGSVAGASYTVGHIKGSNGNKIVGGDWMRDSRGEFIKVHFRNGRTGKLRLVRD